MGCKVLDAGGNAVIGFYQNFDFEEEGIVARGYGTACELHDVNILSTFHFFNSEFWKLIFIFFISL
jgi:hypothetical protein